MENFFRNFNNDRFTIISYMFFLLLVALFKFTKNSKSNNIFSCEKLFLLFYFLFIAIGPILLIIIEDYIYNYNVFALIGGALTCFLVGSSIIGNKIFTIKNKKKVSLIPFKEVNINVVLFNAKLVLLISYCAASFYLLKNLKNILIDFENNRVTAMSGYGIVIYFSYLMLPATWLLFYIHLNYKKNSQIVLIFVLDVFFLMLIGFRSRILELILVTIILINDYKSLPIKKIFKYGVICVLLVSLLQVIRNIISNNTGNILYTLLNTFSVSSINLKTIFSFFPNKIPYQHGYTYLINFYQLTPYSSLDVTMWLKEKMNMSFSGGGITPTVIGELYINWGLAGIFLGMFILGIFCKLFDNYNLYSSDKTNKINYYMLAFYIARGVTGGLANNIIIIIWFEIVVWFLLRIKFGTRINKINE